MSLDVPAQESVARIAGTATALPPHPITREDVKFYLGRVFPLEESRLEGMMAIVDNAKVERRYAIYPIDYLVEPRSLTKISEEYREHALYLARRAAQDALDEAGLPASAIDLIVTVSCTGVMLPSLDAYLINELGFRTDVRRLPVTEIGCAAGAFALAQAWQFLRVPSHRNANVLVVSVELPSLTFQRGNLTQANLISSILFGDGAAAVVLSGSDGSGPCIVGSESHIVPQSLDAVGFDLKDTGFNIVLSKDMPLLIRAHFPALVERLLARHGVRREQVSAFLLHAGGQKLLTSIEEDLGLAREQTAPSWDVLRNYGNQSSASVLFVLREWLKRRAVAAGDYGLLAAFGPGFTTEMVLLRWS